MTEAQWELSEPLRFRPILSKFNKVGSKSIKSAVLDYYKPEDIFI